MDIRTYEVTVRGSSPLILHRDDIEWADQMDAWKDDPANKRKSRAGDDRTPAWRYIGCFYHDGEFIGIETDNFQKCFMEGGAMVPVPGGKNGKTFKSQTQSGMALAGSLVPVLVNGKKIHWKRISALENEPSLLTHKHALEELGFELKIKRAAVGSSKHIRVRPMFPQWAMAFRLAVWDEQLTEGALRDIISFSGQYKGIGDWRPSSKKSPGPHGRFVLEKLDSVLPGKAGPG